MSEFSYTPSGDDFHSPIFVEKGTVVNEPIEECVFCLTKQCTQIQYDDIVVHGVVSNNVTPIQRIEI